MENERLVKIVSLGEADAIAFGCLTKSDKHNYNFIPFKMTPLLDDEIRIKVLYTGICQSDILWSNGTREEYLPILFPCVPGHEVIGEVMLKGKAVNNLDIGDIVGFSLFTNSCGKCHACLSGKENLCMKVKDNIIFTPNFGGWASHFQGKAKHAVKIPKEIPLELCPPLLCSGVSLFSAINKNIRQGNEVAVVGIGETSLMAVKMLKKIGCKVSVIASSLDTVIDLKHIGVNSFITPNNISSFLLNKTIDVIMCCVSEGSFDEYIKLLKKGGKFICVLPLIPEVSLDLYYIVFNEIQIQGAFIGGVQDIKDCLDFCAKNKIFPNVEICNFDEFPKAVHRVHYEKPNQRCVVKCLSSNFAQFN